MKAPYDGATFVADTSAWARAHHPRVRDEWAAALRNRQLATCPIVKLELLYSARNGDDVDDWRAHLSSLRDVPVTRSVTTLAENALAELAHRHPLYHRSVRLPDLLIAACAADGGIGVLHYDADFDRLAEVLAFESRWLASRGSLS